MPPVTLATRTPVNERVLTFGAPAAGKSFGWLTIAAHTPPTTTIHVLDTDVTTDAMLWNSEEFAHLRDRVVNTVPQTWQDYVDWAKNTAGAQRGDWRVVDMMTQAWEAVQADYILQVFGMDMAEYFVQMRADLEEQRVAARKEHKKEPGVGNPLLEHFTAINNRYREFTGYLLRSSAHLYMTAGSKSLNERFDKDDVQKLYGRVSAKPDAQKQTGHLAATVLFMSGTSGGDHYVTTVKDRQRVPLEFEKWTDLGMTYLVRRAGWTPVAMNGQAG